MIKPFSKENWQGRTDVEDGILGVRWHQLIKEFPKEHAAYLDKAVVFLGFACDEGVRRNKGRAGAAKAPDLVRKMLSVLPRQESNVSALYDYGNVVCVGDQLEAARDEQVAVLTNILGKKTIPVVIGGGHETALGNYLALDKVFKQFGIINIDAHFDLRLPYPDSTSGTPFYEMSQDAKAKNKAFDYCVLGVQQNGNTGAIFERAKQLNVSYLTADDIHDSEAKWMKMLDAFLAKHKHIYLSLDMDVFDSAFAPGVSASNACGLHPYQVKKILRRIMKSNKVRLMDVVETNPDFDQDNRTTRLAAHMISEMVHGL